MLFVRVIGKSDSATLLETLKVGEKLEMRVDGRLGENSNKFTQTKLSVGVEFRN